MTSSAKTLVVNANENNKNIVALFEEFYAKTLDELREKESAVLRDKSDGIRTEARNTTLNDIMGTLRGKMFVAEMAKDLMKQMKKKNTFLKMLNQSKTLLKIWVLNMKHI